MTMTAEFATEEQRAQLRTALQTIADAEWTNLQLDALWTLHANPVDTPQLADVLIRDVALALDPERQEQLADHMDRVRAIRA